ncbi:DUF11 domain-containing protein [Candidatus Peregrinibacteria bacterium]|nr:DUF11 domain-containing protein [Candidatus Peregrinibacteria bacterium]
MPSVQNSAPNAALKPNFSNRSLWKIFALFSALFLQLFFSLLAESEGNEQMTYWQIGPNAETAEVKVCYADLDVSDLGEFEITQISPGGVQNGNVIHWGGSDCSAPLQVSSEKNCTGELNAGCGNVFLWTKPKEGFSQGSFSASAEFHVELPSGEEVTYSPGANGYSFGEEKRLDGVEVFKNATATLSISVPTEGTQIITDDSGTKSDNSTTTTPSVNSNTTDFDGILVDGQTWSEDPSQSLPESSQLPKNCYPNEDLKKHILDLRISESGGKYNEGKVKASYYEFEENGQTYNNRGCVYKIGFASYQVFYPQGDPNFAKTQKLFDHLNNYVEVPVDAGFVNFGPIEVPTCQYQVDALEWNVAGGHYWEPPANSAGQPIFPGFLFGYLVTRGGTLPLCESAPVIKGFHDSISCNFTTGWACDSFDFTKPLYIWFSEGSIGDAFGAVLADKEREPAVASLCGENANHGFVFPIPEKLKDGQLHNIYAYASNNRDGENVLQLLPPTASLPNPVNFTCQEKLTLIKTASVPEVQPGGKVTYTVTYANNSDEPARNVAISDILPVNATLDMDSVQIVSGPSMTWFIPLEGALQFDFTKTDSFGNRILDPHTGGVLRYTVTVKFDATQTVKNEACIFDYTIGGHNEIVCGETTVNIVKKTCADLNFHGDPAKIYNDIPNENGSPATLRWNNVFSQTATATITKSTNPAQPVSVNLNNGQYLDYPVQNTTYTMKVMDGGATLVSCPTPIEVRPPPKCTLTLKNGQNPPPGSDYRIIPLGQKAEFEWDISGTRADVGTMSPALAENHDYRIDGTGFTTVQSETGVKTYTLSLIKNAEGGFGPISRGCNAAFNVVDNSSSADIFIQKIADKTPPDYYYLGQFVTYTLAFGNSGGKNIPGPITITDDLPINFTADGFSFLPPNSFPENTQCQFNATRLSISCTKTDGLSPNSSYDISFKLRVMALLPGPDREKVTNEAIITPPLPLSPKFASVTIIVKEPTNVDLSLVKYVRDTQGNFVKSRQAAIGDILTYKLVYKNESPWLVNGSNEIYDFPGEAGLLGNYVFPTTGDEWCRGDTKVGPGGTIQGMKCTFGFVLPGQGAEILYQAKVLNTTDGKKIKNTAQIIPSIPDIVPANNTSFAEVTVAIPTPPNLYIDKTLDIGQSAIVDKDSEVRYVLTFGNRGGTIAKGLVTITDTTTGQQPGSAGLVVNYVIESVSPEGGKIDCPQTIEDTGFTCTIPEGLPANSGDYQIKYHVRAERPGNVINKATLSSTNPVQSVFDTQTITITPLSSKPDLTVTKTIIGGTEGTDSISRKTVKQGDTVEFKLEIKNIGTIGATNIKFSDGVTNWQKMSAPFDTNSTQGTTCDFPTNPAQWTGILNCTIGSLSSLGTGGNTAVITYKMTALAVTQTEVVTNTATVDPNHEIDESNELNNSDQAIVTIGSAVQKPDLIIEKYIGAIGTIEATVNKNTLVTYILRYRNQGPVAIPGGKNIQIKDQVTSGTGFISARFVEQQTLPPGVSCPTGPITGDLICTISNTIPANSDYYVIHYTIQAIGGDGTATVTVKNTVTIDATNVVDEGDGANAQNNAVIPGSGESNNTASATLNISSLTAPTCSNFIANPSSIVVGESSVLDWDQTNGISATINGANVSLINGPYLVSPTVTTEYLLRIIGVQGTTPAECRVIVTVTTGTQNPTCSNFTATPSSIFIGSSSRLRWDQTNGVTAEVRKDSQTGTLVFSGGANADDNDTNPVNITPTETTLYYLKIIGAAGTTPATCFSPVTVTIVPSIDLKVVKQAVNNLTERTPLTEVQPGQEFYYIVQYSNEGSAPTTVTAPNVQFIDDYDETKLTILDQTSIPAQGCTLSTGDGKITCAIGDLGPRGNLLPLEKYFKVKVNAALQAGQTATIFNEVDIEVTPGTPNPPPERIPANNHSEVTVTVKQGMIILEKSVEPISVDQIKSVTYTIKARNTTNAPQSFILKDAFRNGGKGDNNNTGSISGCSNGTPQITFDPLGSGSVRQGKGTYPEFGIDNLTVGSTVTVSYLCNASNADVPQNGGTSRVINDVIITDTTAPIDSSKNATVTLIGPNTPPPPGCTSNCGGGGGGGGGYREIRGEIILDVMKEVMDKDGKWQDANTADLAALIAEQKSQEVKYRIRIKNTGRFSSYATEIEDVFVSPTLIRKTVENVQGAKWDALAQRFTVDIIGTDTTAEITYTSILEARTNVVNGLEGVNTALIKRAGKNPDLPFNYVLEKIEGVGSDDPAYVKTTAARIVTGDISLKKTVDKEFVRPGEELYYTISIRNIGEKDFINMAIIDEFPFEYLDILEMDAKGVQMGNTLVFRKRVLRVGDPWTVNIKTRVKEETTNGIVIVNIAGISADDEDFSDKKVRTETTVIFTPEPPLNVSTGTANLAFFLFLLSATYLYVRRQAVSGQR